MPLLVLVSSTVGVQSSTFAFRLLFGVVADTFLGGAAALGDHGDGLVAAERVLVFLAVDT